MMNTLRASSKVSLRRVRPNALFEDWVTNLYEEAKAKKSKLEPMLKDAMDSLSKYPLPLKSGAECMILKGFGKKLCEYLDQCLDTFNSNLEVSENCDSELDNNRITSSDKPILSSFMVSENVSTVPNSTSDLPHVYNPSTIPKTSQHTEVTSSDSSHQVEDGVPKINTESVSPTNIKRGNVKSKSKKYKPAHRSGGYAILVSLLDHSLENPDKPTMTKEELIEKAQKHSEESFVRVKPDSFYTAWSNMTRLVAKGLVLKSRRKKVEYALTEKGKQLAQEILKEAGTTSTINDIIFANDKPSTSGAFVKQNVEVIAEEVPSTSQNTNNNVIIMQPGSFDIILLIDKNETGGLKKKNDPTVAQFNKYPDLKHEYRSLKVGDFTWIAKSKVNSDEELVLPFVVERKRMDDLGASIKDGRFHEQKFRLRKCGLYNVIYMVENYGKNKHVGLPIQSLMQALANTRVQDGFKVHVTDSLTNSARFLAMMTRRLTIRYKGKKLEGHSGDPCGDYLMTYGYFNKSSAKTKTLTVTETFIKLLLQLKGVSVEKALAITNKYSTPRSLIVAYAKCSKAEGESLLAHLKYGDLSRNVGPMTSKTIYQLFTNCGDQ